MENVLEYKGYLTRIEYSVDDKVLHGKIEGINDLVTFESGNACDIEDEFHAAVDDYIEFCNENGVQPDKTYSGTFNVRIMPSLHKEISAYAFKKGITMNKAVEIAISDFLAKEKDGYQVVAWENTSKAFNVTKALSTAVPSFQRWEGGVAHA